MASQPRRYLSSVSKAFTLIELLVVVTIIAVLLAVLLAAIGRMQESAKGATCLSNLRQMGIAAQQYAMMSDGSYPTAYYFSNDGSVSFCWDLTTIDPPGGAELVVPGILWQGSGVERIQQCPSFEGAANWLNDPYTGYNYNTSYIGHGQFESIPDPVKAASVLHGSTTALFGDGQWAGGADKFMRAPFPNPGDNSFSGRWAGTQGFRHWGRTNVAFCDGHAEALSDCFTANFDGAENVAPGTGFLSKDNRFYDPAYGQ